MHRKLVYLLPIFIFLVSCQTESKQNSERDVETNWEFKNFKDTSWLSAVVPGSIHEDLLDHTLIPDPFIGENEKKVQWVEKETWEYKTTLVFSKAELSHDFIQLTFEGVDTYSSIFLNDSLLGKTNNMFIAYEYTLPTKNLKTENKLRVVLHSPVKEGEKIKGFTDYAIPFHSEQIIEEGQIATSNLTRKAHYHYGWDFGPRLVTSGIWKPIHVKAWSGASIKSVFHQIQDLTHEEANYVSIVEVLSSKNQKAKVQVSLSEKGRVSEKLTFDLKEGINKLEVPFKVLKPNFWFPHNYGKPFLYQASLELELEDGGLEIHQQKLGVRTLKIEQEPDSLGTSFSVVVNGIPIFCKGANYIPPHFFNGRLDSGNYAIVIENAREANLNMLRVWGGGVYEKDEFYELCDKRGILVWQDFMFACNMYRGDSSFLESVEKEARQNVKRLRTHSSVALWTGNNEILSAWKNWGWKERFDLSEAQSNEIWKDYRLIFHTILDKVIKDEDPQKLYWPSSPSAGFDDEATNKSGDSHFWDVWFGQKGFAFYQDVDCRFVSEFGFQSFPELKTIYEFSGDSSNVGVNTPFMENRQRCKMDWMKPGMNGNLLIKQYMDQYYGVYDDFEDFVYVSQLMHADAMKYGIEAFRLGKPNTMGALFWQIDDCWPTVSWSSIDYYGKWKAPHFAAKRANSNLFIGAEWKGDELRVKGSFDGLEFPKVVASVTYLDEKGGTIWEESLKSLRMKNTENEVFFKIKRSRFFDKKGVLLMNLVSLKDSVSNVLFLEDYKDFVPKDEKVIITTKKGLGFFELTLVAASFQRGVRIQSNVEGKFSDNYFDLLPNKPHVIKFESKVAVKPVFNVKAFGWN